MLGSTSYCLSAFLGCVDASCPQPPFSALPSPSWVNNLVALAGREAGHGHGENWGQIHVLNDL